MAKFYGTAALAAAALSVIALSACSSAGGSSAGQPANGTTGRPASPVASATTHWAGSVCSSAQNLNQSLRNLAASLSANSNTTNNVSQLKQRLQSGLSSVETAADSVTARIKNVPPSADQSVKNAQRRLQASATRSQQALHRLRTAAGQLRSDTTSGQFAQDYATVGGAAAIAAGDLGSMLGSLRGYASSTRGDIRQAFGSAPSCQQLRKT